MLVLAQKHCAPLERGPKRGDGYKHPAAPRPNTRMPGLETKLDQNPIMIGQSNTLIFRDVPLLI